MCATAIRRRPTSCAWTASRAIMMNIMKTGSSSTLDIIKGVREKLSQRQFKGQLPPQLKISALSDQSIFVRERHQRRGPRGHYRRLPHGHHDPGLPGQLALHDHHRGLHSALDSLLAHRALRAARDHQHHDPGRHGAGRGHPGRRRHRRHRKHQPQSGDRARSWSRPFSTARRRLPLPRWFPRSPSASCLCPCSS